ncbi:MAG TPA: glycoside hydrolase family 88 protein [Pyrinomonadaceae bacterium]|nr:glycoside hydrolase family 88 protein [Pyrinomonadaceae bacterium]
MNYVKDLLARTLVCAVCVWAMVGQSGAQAEYFGKWPKGESPEELGKLVAENWVERDFEYQSGKRPFVIYPEACTWYGALNVSKAIKDEDLRTRLVRKFDRFFTPEGAKAIAPNAHVDYRVIGIIPLEIYLQTQNRRHLDFGQAFADKQWDKTTADGITAEARYWIDDMYMITAVQTQAYRAAGDKKYIERAARTMVAYLDKLQQPNGLFFHAPDAQFYWGRGNGWQAAGMSELLLSLPKNHPSRPRILKGYKLMMASLLKYQSEDGMWRQLLDHPESWVETSGTGMFTFAMVTGVKQGWLPKKTYGPAARKAWLGLAKYIKPNGDVTEVCEGTNKGFSVQYYMDRARKTGDLHGQAATLWSAMALLR